MIAFAVFAFSLIAVNADPILLKKDGFFPTGRIVGGENAVIETYPYQVSLEEFGRHLCGASIISSHWIITAGHCVDVYAEFLRVRSGTSVYEKGGKIHQVEKAIRHEDYYLDFNGIPHNDIAILRVKEPFHFDDTQQPINLFNANEEAKAGVKAVVTGWGDTNEWEYDGQLQTVSIPIVSKELCNEAYKKDGGLPEGQICAAYYGVGGKDACQGDSGGPLAVDGRLAGIVSWGNGCADPEFPGAYTEVAHYRDWINERVDF